MAAITYPAGLPVPSVIGSQNDERRLVPEQAGVVQTAAMQRDRLATQQLVFVLPTFTECAAWRAWWKDDLVYGAAWFAATWLLPQGMVSGVRHFVGAPRWEYIAPIGWRVTATCELRGRGLAPTTCMHENFVSLAAYQTVTGNRGLFALSATPYGSGLLVSSQAAGIEARIRRAVVPRTCTTISFKVLIGSVQPDDSARLSLFAGGSVVLVLVCMRESALDALRRPYAFLPGQTQALAGAALTINTWYQIDVVLSPTAGATTITLTRLSDSTIIQVTSFSVAQPAVAYDALDFSADSGGATCPTTFAAVEVC